MVQEHANNHHHLQQQLAKYGTGGSGTGAATGVARASRKNKPKKIPQRGLGVAQLEKLRIEEQKKMGGSPAPSVATPSSHALNGGRGLCQLPTLHHHPPPAPPLSVLSRPVADGGAHCGFRPVLWSPVDPAKNPYKRSMPPPLPMVSTGLSLTAPSSHPAEPPSNQMYSSSSSRSSPAAPVPVPAPTEEESRETAGVDRYWPFMFEGMTAFRTTSKALPPPPLPPPPFALRTASDSGLPDVSPDLSRYEFRATNYFSPSAYANCSDWTSELAHCKEAGRGRGRDAALLTLSSRPPHLARQPHVAPSMHVPEYNDFSASAMPSQGSVSASSSLPPQPFYTFLPVGPVRRRERTPTERKSDAPEGGVDLELKLWKG